MKIGDYIRTKWGRIGKIRSFSKSICFDIKENEQAGEAKTKESVYVDTYYNFEDEPDIYSTDEIVKFSPNLVDILEIGDYVNGFIVNDKVENKFNLVGDFDTWLESKDIKSIVTKEQFASYEYKVGKDE